MAQRNPDSPLDLIERTKEGLMSSPGWARVGLTFGDERLREAALTELAVSIAHRIADLPHGPDPDQLTFQL